MSVMSILIAILVFSLLILVHEFGHFAAAKLLGVRVLEFSLFMGPRLFSFKRGETRYSVKLIPVGGSCLMEGEEQSSSDGRALLNKPKRVRAAIMAAGPVINLLFAFACVFAANILSGYQDSVLSAVEPGSPAAVASTPLQAGDRIVSYGGHSVHSPMELAIFAQETRGEEAVVTFVRDGERRSATIKPETYEPAYYMLGFVGSSAYGEGWNLAVSVDEGAPAYAAGMRAGDRLTSVAGRAPQDREDLRGILAEAGGAPVTIEWISPDGMPGSGVATAGRSDSYGGYETGARFRQVARPGFFEAAAQSFHESVSYAKMVLYSLKWLVTGQVGVDQLSGPVGIVTEISSVVSQDVNEGVPEDQGMSAWDAFLLKLFYLMRFSAVIGVNLGLVNLIPFPALDGSKLLLIGVEAVRRKAIPPEREAVISFAGLIALMAVMAFTLFNDIARIVGK